jgi:hypothetical protein
MSFAVFVSLIDFLPMLDSGYLPLNWNESSSKYGRGCEQLVQVPGFSKTRAMGSDAATLGHPLPFRTWAKPALVF